MKKIIIISLLMFLLSNNIFALFSYSWIRDCGNGNQEYFSLILDEGNVYIKYDGCDGVYHEWYYSNNIKDKSPYIKGDKIINKAFNDMIQSYKNAISKKGITEKELSTTMVSALKKSVAMFKKDGQFTDSSIKAALESYKKRKNE
ncbi:MAG: hypothetical protein FJ214_11630 [Ignavibacteria bacterium]|nr:hypothetical protein [Ignavibacteria bacterium]